MTYQVLARKWRPRTFEQMVGQQHVLRALINALNDNQLHHAYLFTGTRGVGKTTLARILAKCLNCEAGVSSTPCQECSACKEIDEGRFVDLLEVDAASHTGVDNIRELTDNVQYSPARGRYKVYLIDEVHMLTKHAFNAMLKTLEEPPPHVIFLLATTDPQALPVTVLSRCLQFNLKAMGTQMIAGHLQYIVEQEKLTAEPEGLRELARAADGSMRDALSLLDQGIAYGGGAVNAADMHEMLGTISARQISDLCAALAAADAPAIMAAVSQLAEQAADFAGVLAELISVLHQVALQQAIPGALEEGAQFRDSVELLAGALSREDVQLYYQICLLSRRDLPLAPDPRSGFEMAMLRLLSFRPAESGGAVSDATPVAPSVPVVKPDVKPAATAPVAPQPEAQSDNVKPPPARAAAGSRLSADNWNETIKAMSLQGPAFALARCCSLGDHEGDTVRLVLDEQHSALRTTNAERRLREAVGQYLQADVNVQIEVAGHASATPDQIERRHEEDRQRLAEQSIEQDSVVRSFQEQFGATVVPGSIKPLGASDT